MNRAENEGAAGRATGASWFRAGAIGLLVFGAVHLLAVYKALFVAPTSAPEQRAVDALQAVSQQLGPLRFSAWGGVQILNASYSILLFQSGALSLLALRPALASGQLRRLATANCVFAALLMVPSGAFQFPPPFIFAAVILVLFLVARAKAPRSAPPR